MYIHLSFKEISFKFVMCVIISLNHPSKIKIISIKIKKKKLLSLVYDFQSVWI